jgi:zinc transport system permease protein
VSLFYKEFLAVSYDEEFAFVRGIPVTLFYFILLSMTSLAVVVTIKVVGLILVIALLSIPPSIAEDYTHSLGGTMFMASLFGIFFTVCGLYLSYNYNLPSGAAIIMVAGAAFFISKTLCRLGRRPAASSCLSDK